MSVVVEASSGDNSGAGTSSSYVTVFEVGYSATDDHVAILSVHFGGTSLTASTPAGWTDVPGFTFPIEQGSNSRAYMYYRVLQNGDSAPTVTISGASTGGWLMTVLSGVDTADIFGQIGTATADATTVDLAALTGVLADAMLIAHSHHRVPSGTTPPTAITPAGTYTELVDHQTSRPSGSAQNVTMESASRSIATAGNYGGDTFSNVGSVSGSWISFHIELNALIVAAATASRDYSVRTELLLEGELVDISDRPRFSDGNGITISRGRQTETSTASPIAITARLLNTDRALSLRNPESSYWGRLKRGTILQTGVLLASDAFGRTVSNGLGTADFGGDYTISGTTSNFSVGSGVASLSFSAVNTRMTALLYGSLAPRNYTVRANVAAGVVATGGAFRIDVITRAIDEDNCYIVALIYGTDSEIDINIYKRVSGVLTHVQPFVLFDGSIPYDASTVIQVNVAMYENSIFARATDLANPTNTIKALVTDAAATYPNAAYYGFGAALPTGVTNTLPVVITVDELYVTDIRGIVEVPSWPQEQDSTGRVTIVPLNGFGILADLESTEPVLPVPPKQYILDLVAEPTTTINIVAAWALDEGPDSAVGAPLTGGRSMKAFNGRHPSGGAISTVPYFGRGSLGSFLPPAFTWSGNTDLSIIWSAVNYEDDPANLGIALNFCYAGTADSPISFVDINPSYLVTDGATGWPQLLIEPDLRRIGATIDGDPEQYASVPSLFDGNVHAITFTIVPSGSDLLWDIYVDGKLATIKAMTGDAGVMPNVKYLAFGCETAGSDNAPSLGYAFLSANRSVNNVAFYKAAKGYANERAGDRIVRLANENNIDFILISTTTDTVGPTGDDTPLMGPQQQGTLTDIWRHCEYVDGGLLYEAPNFPGMVYRTRQSLYNQGVTLALDYSNKQLGAEFHPDPDTLTIVNSMTLSRTDGGSITYEKIRGPLNLNSKLTDKEGVGNKPQTQTVNVATDSQLRNIAGWKVHNGTIDEDRYPDVPVHLHTDVWVASAVNTQDALETTLGRRVSLANLPNNFTADTSAQLVIGTRETLTQVTRSLHFNCTPASAVNPGVWNTSKYAPYDTTLVTAVSSSATSMDVASTANSRLWTTDNGQMPIAAMMEGEQLSITAIATSTYTMGVAGTAAHANNADVIPGLPAGHSTGSVLCILAAIRETTANPVAPAGYTTLVDFGNVKIFAKISTGGSESAPTVTFTGGATGDTTTAQMFYFDGLYGVGSLSNLVANSAYTLNGSQQDVPVRATGIFETDCLVLRLAWKADDSTGVATLSGMTELIDTSTTTGNDQTIALDYAVQTAQTPLQGDTFTVSGGAGAVSLGGTVIIRPDVQRLTVTRSVNGITKSQTVNAALKLHPRVFWGL